MDRKTKALIALVPVVLVVMVAMYAVSANAQSYVRPTLAQTSFQLPQNFAGGYANGPILRKGSLMQPSNRLVQTAGFTVGQTFTVTSTQGRWRALGVQGQNGTASGTITFTVTGKFSKGYSLSISGNFALNGVGSYTISSGSAQMGPFGQALSGQGVSSGGPFLIQAQAYGNFAGAQASVSLDFTQGTTEYAVTLRGSVQG